MPNGLDICDPAACENRTYMRTQNLMTLILKFHNFVPKHSSSIKILQSVQHAMGNLEQFTEYV